jgi:hypothetical protein
MLESQQIDLCQGNVVLQRMGLNGAADKGEIRINWSSWMGALKLGITEELLLKMLLGKMSFPR